MGRPKKPAAEQKTRIGVSLSPRVLRMLDWLAAENGWNRSQTVHNFIVGEITLFGGNPADKRFDPPKEKSK